MLFNGILELWNDLKLLPRRLSSLSSQGTTDLVLKSLVELNTKCRYRTMSYWHEMDFRELCLFSLRLLKPSCNLLNFCCMTMHLNYFFFFVSAHFMFVLVDILLKVSVWSVYLLKFINITFWWVLDLQYIKQVIFFSFHVIAS